MKNLPFTDTVQPKWKYFLNILSSNNFYFFQNILNIHLICILLCPFESFISFVFLLMWFPCLLFRNKCIMHISVVCVYICIVRLIYAKLKVSCLLYDIKMKLINNCSRNKLLLEEIMSWAKKYSTKRRRMYCLFTLVRNFDNVRK